MSATVLYPTDGARVFAETGKAKYQIVIDEAGIPAEDRTAVVLEMNRILHLSGGWIPSTAAAEAVRRYRANPAAVLER